MYFLAFHDFEENGKFWGMVSLRHFFVLNFRSIVTFIFKLLHFFEEEG